MYVIFYLPFPLFSVFFLFFFTIFAEVRGYWNYMGFSRNVCIMDVYRTFSVLFIVSFLNNNSLHRFFVCFWLLLNAKLKFSVNSPQWPQKNFF